MSDVPQVTLSDYILAQIDAGATVSVRLGREKNGNAASLMTWSDRTSGTYFWRVEGNTTKLMGFMGENELD
jgi:hypothetical protein